MKKLLTMALLAAITTAAKAQSDNSSQTVSMGVSATIEMTFTGSNSATGGTVNLAFNTVNDYANGVSSADQQLKVTSNKNFAVAVKTGDANFSYSGATSPAPVMPVSGVLGLMVSANSTGGSIVSPFASTSYAGLTSSSQNLLSNATAGNNQLFSVRYKATPGFSYPSGTYTVNVLYTATQL